MTATLLDKVRADQTRTATTITLAGNGRLLPSSLTESEDQPRRLVLDFPNVSPAAAARTAVDSVFVKQVRVALNSRAPLVTRVVMDISASAAYHVERTGPDGRDLAVVFEGRKSGSAVCRVGFQVWFRPRAASCSTTSTPAQALAHTAASRMSPSMISSRASPANSARFLRKPLE